MIGISIKLNIGIGDAVEFTTVPENYFRQKGEKLVDMTSHWCLDHNPFIVRSTKENPITPEKVFEVWNYTPRYMPKGRLCYTSLAEKLCGIFDVPVVMKFPRLYIYEDFPIEKREKILLHTSGRSHGEMPDHVLGHILEKYKNMQLYHIGLEEDKRCVGIPHIHAATMWELVKVISECRMFIGMDSGPSWIANCYPDIVLKKLRTKPTLDYFKNWVPLDVMNVHAQWDDREHHVYNVSPIDIGFTCSYLRI